MTDQYRAWPASGTFVPSFACFEYRDCGDGLVFRVEVTQAHCNGRGIAHGGFLCTLADAWLAGNVARQLPAQSCFSTASLMVDFLKPAVPGDILASHVDRIKAGRRLCFAQGAILRGAEPIATMRATFVRLDFDLIANPASV